MRENVHVLILAGGSGTRFWPLSRAAKPKQFLDVVGIGKSLLQATWDRVTQLIPPERVWVAGHQQHADLLRAQLPAAFPDRLLLEPIQRNTAATILWATELLAQEDPTAILWILPADHFIPDEGPFLTLLHRIFTQCDFSEAIFTVGIKPRYPHTGYGYIQFVPTPNRLCQPVKTFTEKPSYELAEVFLQSGDFLWNSGMFIAQVSVLQKAFRQHLPEMYEIFCGMTFREGEPLRQAFQRAPSISFDYAIMERYQPVMVVEGQFRWWDLGGWNALYEISPKEGQENALRAHAYVQGTKRSLILSSQPSKLLIVSGLEDFLVIDTEDALLILPRTEEQSIREWVQRLRTEGETAYL